MKFRVDEKSLNLASIDLDTGIITVNNQFLKLDLFTQNFILEHEKGHYENQNLNEFEADNYAFLKLRNTKPESLKNIVISLLNTLDFNQLEHNQRFFYLLKNIALFDYFQNNNKQALILLKKMNHAIKRKRLIARPSVLGIHKITPDDVTKTIGSLKQEVFITPQQEVELTELLSDEIDNSAPFVIHEMDSKYIKGAVKNTNINMPANTQESVNSQGENDKAIDISVTNEPEKSFFENTTNLIIIAVVVIAGIYFFTQRKSG